MEGKSKELVVNSEHQMLQTLVESKALPGYIKNYSIAFAFNQFGKELGFKTMQAFHYLTMIDGKISLTVMAMEAMLLKNNIIIEKITDGEYLYKDGTLSYGNYFSEEKGGPIDRVTELRLTRTFHNGTVISEVTRYTFVEAKEAGLVDKNNWRTYRRDMLWSRCLSRAARRIAADIFSGLYTADELVDLSKSKETYDTNDRGYINVDFEEPNDMGGYRKSDGKDDLEQSSNMVDVSFEERPWETVTNSENSL